MEIHGYHPLLEYTDEEMQYSRQVRGLTESGIRDSIVAIQEWFQKQPHLVEAGIDEAVIERMILLSNGSTEKAKHRIDHYYKYRGLVPELIQGRKRFLMTETNDFFCFYKYAIMPKLFEGTKRITYALFDDPDSNNFSLDTLLRNSMIMIDIKLTHDYFLGEIFVADLKAISVSHLLRLNPVLLQKFLSIVQDGIGIKVYAVHIINLAPMAEAVVNFVKQFLKPKIADRFIVHKSPEELHKYFPADYIPADYGGSQPCLEHFKEITNKMLREDKTKEFLLERCNQVSDESRRPHGGFNEEFMAGTFKKLDLD